MGWIAQIIQRVDSLLAEGETPVIVAIDGPCGSGKTTLANQLLAYYDCNVFRADDFFLRTEQRTPERFAQPGGNLDRERLRAEILLPLSQGERVRFRPFDCKSGCLKPVVEAPCKRLNFVEGTYTLHPELEPFYQLKLFLTVEREEQLRRLARREGERLTVFRSRWIPLEDAYFSALSPQLRADLCLKT